MSYNVKISPQEHTDITNIKNYVSKDGESIALKQIQLIFEALETLSEFPNLGRKLRKFINTPTDYRFKLINGTYLAFYKISGENVEISRIIRAEQDYVKILKLTAEDGENN